MLERGLTDLALPLDALARRDRGHARLLLAWNKHVNLSGLRTPAQVARGHVLDSLLAVATLRGLRSRRPSLLDLGSGGGYPGLPLAVALPARRAALVDSIGKKAAFLEVAAQAVTDALRAAPVSASNTPELAVLAERAEDRRRTSVRRGTSSPRAPSALSLRWPNWACHWFMSVAMSSSGSWPARPGLRPRIARRRASAAGGSAASGTCPRRRKWVLRHCLVVILQRRARRPDATRAHPASAPSLAATLTGGAHRVLSDIHGNLPALEAVLAELTPYDALWQLGDIVGYGPQPDEVVARLVERGRRRARQP